MVKLPPLKANFDCGEDGVVRQRTMKRAAKLTQMSELVTSDNHVTRVNGDSWFEGLSDHPSGNQNSSVWRDPGIIPVGIFHGLFGKIAVQLGGDCGNTQDKG